MYSLDPEAWKNVRGMIINELSSRFSLGYLAEELLGPSSVQKSKFLFGFANERGNKRTSKKLRVIIAKEQLLKTAWLMNNPLSRDDRPEDAQPEEPVYGTDYHRERWIHTVRNMADLHHDMERWEKDNKPLREIELCVPAPEKLALSQVLQGEGDHIIAGQTSMPALRRNSSGSYAGGSILLRGQSHATTASDVSF